MVEELQLKNIHFNKQFESENRKYIDFTVNNIHFYLEIERIKETGKWKKIIIHHDREKSKGDAICPFCKELIERDSVICRGAMDNAEEIIRTISNASSMRLSLLTEGIEIL